MDINTIIERIEEVKPNILSDELKFSWVSSLDSRINREVFKNNTELIYKSGEDGERKLLVSSPYDDMYFYYVSAMIDFSNNEIGEYNNNMALFNEKYTAFAKDYRRNNLPRNQGGFTNVI